VHRGNGLSQPALTTYKAAVPHGFVSQDQSLLETTLAFRWRRLRGLAYQHFSKSCITAVTCHHMQLLHLCSLNSVVSARTFRSKFIVNASLVFAVMCNFFFFKSSCSASLSAACGCWHVYSTLASATTNCCCHYLKCCAH
jgi:hypothetical protein